MKIVYRVSREDYLGAVSLFLANQKPWYRRILRQLLPWLGGTLVLIEVASAILIPHRDLLTAGAGSLFGLYFVYCGFAIRRTFRRIYEKNNVYRHDFSAEFTENGIRVTTATSETDYKWSGFIRYVESEKLFMLYLSEVTYVAFPRHAFGADQIAEFEEVLRVRVPAQPKQ